MSRAETNPDARSKCFIGSSSEGAEHARALQTALESSGICWVDSWTQGVFEVSGYPVDSLIAAARRADFAVLIATPDDTTESRGEAASSPRDNIIFELGLFMGVLGRERTYVLSTTGHDLKLPSDLQGLTRLAYTNRPDGNLVAAMNTAVGQVRSRIQQLGAGVGDPQTGADGNAAAEPLKQEIDILCANAEAQGWRVRTNTPTTLRLVSPGGKAFVLTKSAPVSTRTRLREYVAQLRGNGLRVNDSLRRSVEESPFS